MAVVRNLHAVLEEAVEATLREVGNGYDDTHVVFDLQAIVHLIEEGIEGEEDTEVDHEVDEHQVCLRHQMFWRVHLFVQTGNRYVQCQGAVPYEACTAGDTSRLKALVRDMWAQQVFTSLMLASDLDSSLDEIASTHDGGGG